MNKTLKELQPVLNELCFNSGDCDECCMKHFENGLCILYTGGNPCDQTLYIDYQDSGVSEDEWLKYEADNSYEPIRTFRGDLWKVIYNKYNNLPEEDREHFWSKVHPYGYIKDCYWLHLYQ